MKKRYITDLKIGEQIDDIFALVEKQIGHKKDGNTFANMTFADKTGQIRAVMWDNIDSLLVNISVGNFVRISAYVGEYRRIAQLVLKDIELIKDETAIDVIDFLPVTGRNINQMFDRLKNISNTLNNAYLKRLFELFWEDSVFVEQFKRVPAAKQLHHAYIGGLLEHSLSMALIGEQIAIHYSGIDRDLLLAGIILHDIGKVKELSFRKNIDYTDQGRLLSHIVLGITMVDEKIRQIPDFPEETEFLLKHLIISHHGFKEFGSPEVPKTIEAILLNCVDDMDFRVNSVREYIDSDSMEGSWTSYNRIMDRHFYKGNSK